MKRREILKEEVKATANYGKDKAKKGITYGSQKVGDGVMKTHVYAQKKKKSYLLQREKDKAQLRNLNVKEKALKQQLRNQRHSHAGMKKSARSFKQSFKRGANKSARHSCICIRL